MTGNEGLFFCAYAVFSLLVGTVVTVLMRRDGSDSENAVMEGFAAACGWPLFLPICGVFWIAQRLTSLVQPNKKPNAQPKDSAALASTREARSERRGHD